MMVQDTTIRDTVEDIFRRYAFGAPDDTIERIERAANLKLDQVTPQNAEPFLLAMHAELSAVMEEWKAKFVTGVLRQLINKRVNL
jgi:hypothetical protein